jgi:hypothetical protein
MRGGGLAVPGCVAVLLGASGLAVSDSAEDWYRRALSVIEAAGGIVLADRDVLVPPGDVDPRMPVVPPPDTGPMPIIRPRPTPPPDTPPPRPLVPLLPQAPGDR